MNYSQILADVIYKKIVSSKILRAGRITVIGIDGPTAAGKTILADNLKSDLEDDGYDVWTYRLDWTLVNRDIRVKDLEKIVGTDTLFKHEAELHMSLNKAVDFLQQVNIYNDELKLGCSDRMLHLEELYSREDDGRNTGKEECSLKKDLVIIIEGHYTLRDELNDLIDFNILLLSDSDVLLDRKINRVSGYRGRNKAKDYFWRVDLPSIRHHLNRYSRNVNLVINNTDVNDPIILTHHQIDEWVRANDNSSEYHSVDEFNENSLVEKILSVSTLVDDSTKDLIKDSVETILKWDRTVGEFIRLSMKDTSSDLYDVTRSLVADLQEKYKTDFNVAVSYTNALHNVYHRRLPVSFGFSFRNINRTGIHFDFAVDSFEEKIRIICSWNGGAQVFTMDRELGQIVDEKNSIVKYIQYKPEVSINYKFKFWLPTPYTKPSFVGGIDNIEYIYTGMEDSNISSTEILCRILPLRNCIWVLRFPKHASVHLFQRILNQFNVSTIKVGNYLISCKTANAGCLEKFKDFVASWQKSYSELKSHEEDEVAYDNQVEKERQDLNNIVKKNCKKFRTIDTHLFTTSTPFDDDWPKVVGQIEFMLRTNNRLLRKRVVELINYLFPDLMLDCKKIWPNLKPGKKNKITINEIVETYPSIMAELFLWTELRGDESAILGANIYDIRGQSLDAYGHLKSSIDKQTAIVIQTSLNAIGQKEDDLEGYLKLEDTPKEYIDSVINTVRQMLVDEVEGKPFYGIGIDHLNKSGDTPPGRAKRFFKKCLDTESVSYFTLDGDILFGASDRSYDELRTSYKKIADFISSLLAGERSTYIFDKEISISELNYIGKETWVPNSQEVKWFVDEFQKCLRDKRLAENNARPTLFIGNIGTTHHSKDLSTDIDSSISKEWVNEVKKYNYVSAVLHGTTNSDRKLLRNANSGCHKINVAGDFLHQLVNLLPKELRQSMDNEQEEYKRILYKYRRDFDRLSDEDNEAKSIRTKFSQYVTKLMSDINSPFLETLDQKFFRYGFYKLSSTEIEEITSKLTEWKEESVLLTQVERTDTEVSYEFSPSMIEVPYNDNFNDIVLGMKQNDIKYFHIDVGDGKFISRAFSGTNKIKAIRKVDNETIIHVHLMALNPYLKNNNKLSVIEEYAKTGVNKIGVHRRSFSDQKGLKNSISMIRKSGAEPGLILETTERINQELFNDIVDLGIEWVVVMGVPIGFGGQLFDMGTLHKISSLHSWALHHKHTLLIEIDGGLTKNNIKLCKEVGAQIFAGWSIVKANAPSDIYKNITMVQNVIR